MARANDDENVGEQKLGRPVTPADTRCSFNASVVYLFPQKTVLVRTLDCIFVPVFLDDFYYNTDYSNTEIVI